MTETASRPAVTSAAVPRVPLVSDESAMRDWATELVARARSEGVELTGDNGLLTGLVRQVLQTGLEVEMSDHLGYERHATEGRGSGNNRNGTTPKTVTTEIGKVDLRVPRDRNATFEPQTVRKGQRRLDGLTGVHLVRSSLRFTSKKYWAPVCRELREIYTAPTVDAAQARFAEFAEHWRDRYPAMIATWERAWDDFVPFLAFPVELRQIVYTTNAIESLNARFRKAVRHRGHFPTEQSALKVLYLVAIERRPNRSNPSGQINGWKQMLNALTIHYGDRIEAAR